MQVTAQLLRAPANRTKLRMLRLLGVLGVSTVTDIAEATGIESFLISTPHER